MYIPPFGRISLKPFVLIPAAGKRQNCSRLHALLVLEVCLAIAGCGGSGSSVNNQPANSQPISNTQPNLAPMISGFSPPCIPAGGSAFSLSVSGQNLVSGSIVRWNGSDRPSTFVSSNKLSAQIPASDIAAAGSAAITVFNPADGSLLSARSTLTIAAGLPPVSVAVDPGGKFAYVAGLVESCGEGFLSTYSINQATGILTNAVLDLDLGNGDRHFVAVDPSGKFVYATDGLNDDVGKVLAFVVDTSTGALTSAGSASNAPCPGLCDPWWLAVDPSGKFVYLADEGGFVSSVSTFEVDGTKGALTFADGTESLGGRANSVAVDPSGRFVYSTTESNNVSMYSINTTTGALTSIGTIAAGTTPASVTVDPSGKWVYVTNAGSNNVSMYAIDPATGSLTSTGLIAAGTNPAFVAVDPTGKFVYVTNAGSNDVSMYSISTADGTLTSIGTIAAESSPGSIAIHPSGKFAYVTNSGSNTVSMYSVETTTGILSLIGKIAT